MAMAPVTIRNDVELYLFQGDDSISGFLAYDTDLFSADTATLLADRFLTALSALVECPDAVLAEVDVRSVGSGSGWVRCRRVRRWRMKRRVGWRSCSRGG